MFKLNLSVRSVFALMSVTCTALLVFGVYLQHVLGLEPCPMCIVQRYAIIFIALYTGLTAFTRRNDVHFMGAVLVFLASGFGAFVAARQSWLQWYPPQEAACGRDFYSMVEMFPLSRLIPMIFKGSGDCARVDWTFLGLSIANWSFLCFVALAIVSVGLLRYCRRLRLEVPA